MRKARRNHPVAPVLRLEAEDLRFDARMRVREDKGG